MKQRHTYLVSADHVHPDYCFTDHPVRVCENNDGTWFADAAKLGCSRDYPSPYAAITALFEAHACTNIRVKP